jgi:enoyl-CoA hydratase/carnithine racemase
VAADGHSVARALELARSIAETAPLSSGAIKTAIRYALSGDAQGARNAFARLWFTEDHKEAESAFAEKRAPRFHGR